MLMKRTFTQQKEKNNKQNCILAGIPCFVACLRARFKKDCPISPIKLDVVVDDGRDRSMIVVAPPWNGRQQR